MSHGVADLHHGECGSTARMAVTLLARQLYPQLRKVSSPSSIYGFVPWHEIATAIARCVGCLAAVADGAKGPPRKCLP